MNHEVIRRTARVRGKGRLGRGYGSGHGGHTSTRGQKGQLSRTGHKSSENFAGGNVPYYRRFPKYRGAENNLLKKEKPFGVNLSTLDSVFSEGASITLDELKSKKLVRNTVTKVKVLGKGKITKSLNIKGLAISESVKKKILESKGTIS